MALDKLKSPAGSRRNIKRVGRGEGSGHGKTSCRGHKGQLARSGGGKGPGFEGGQTPLQRRLPKRGFVNPTRVEYQIVNVGALNVFEAGATVDAAALCDKGLAHHAGRPIKVLGEGDLEKKLCVKADRFSAAAREKIAKAGGTAEEPGSGVNVQ
ncbi:MAG: 50S ribosomal protein L15 [Deltaproteobacteria bacterium]|nr:50S ribosomal protein L15 [Deltaproteobacteria bacterium]